MTRETTKTSEEKLVDLLADMVAQHCRDGEAGVVNSMCISANADAIEELVQRGILIALSPRVGRAIVAKFNEEK